MASTGDSVRGGIKDLPKCGPRGMFVNQGERDIGKVLQERGHYYRKVNGYPYSKF